MSSRYSRSPPQVSRRTTIYKHNYIGSVTCFLFNKEWTTWIENNTSYLKWEVWHLSSLRMTCNFGDLGFVVSLVDLLLTRINHSCCRRTKIRKAININNVQFFTHFCGRNGLSNFGRGLAWGTIVLLICFNAFSSSICRPWRRRKTRTSDFYLLFGHPLEDKIFVYLFHRIVLLP